jgi:hypothetical protein
MGEPTGYIQGTFLSSIGSFVPFVSTTYHPQVEVVSPQGRLSVLVVHSPHLAA